MSENLDTIDEVWYFAFGANMNEKALKRRKVAPKVIYPAKLPNWKFTYNLRGYPFIEPAFATIEECNKSTVHGVCMCITQEEWGNIKRTEGGAGLVKDGYVCIEVEVETYDKKKIKAYTLTVTSNRVRHTKLKHPPSKRYTNLVIEGAENHGLDKDYIESLKSQKYYIFSEHVKSKILIPLCFIGILISFPLVMLIFAIINSTSKSGLSSLNKDMIIKSSFTFSLYISFILWKWHDILYHVFSPLGLMHVDPCDGQESKSKSD